MSNKELKKQIKDILNEIKPNNKSRIELNKYGVIYIFTDVDFINDVIRAKMENTIKEKFNNISFAYGIDIVWIKEENGVVKV